jgi:prepilin peptidase CpaA
MFTSYPITAFEQTPAMTAGGVLFVAALVVASVSDVRSRRIPNGLVLIFALFGFAFSLVALPPLVGLARAVTGLALGFALWIPFYALGMLGAGDVKLFAAASAWLAPTQVFGAALVSALAGGVLSIVGLMMAHGIGLTAFRLAHVVRDPKLLSTQLPVPAGRRTLPYGLAMAIGLIVIAWWPHVFGIR